MLPWGRGSTPTKKEAMTLIAARLAVMLVALTLIDCGQSFPVLGDPEPEFMRDEALREANAMIGKRYDLTGWHKLCPNFESSVGCEWIEKGRFITDRVILVKPGYIIIHVTFNQGSAGFMQYTWHHAGVSPISVEEFYAEKGKEREREEARSRCTSGILKLQIGMSADAARRAVCEPQIRNSTITANHVLEQ
jgi:hypothetical protein